jgi:hypothetical protein
MTAQANCILCGSAAEWERDAEENLRLVCRDGCQARVAEAVCEALLHDPQWTGKREDLRRAAYWMRYYRYGKPPSPGGYFAPMVLDTTEPIDGDVLAFQEFHETYSERARLAVEVLVACNDRQDEIERVSYALGGLPREDAETFVKDLVNREIVERVDPAKLKNVRDIPGVRRFGGSSFWRPGPRYAEWVKE